MSNEFWARVRRLPAQGMIAGVCAGVAHYFDWNARVLRVAFVLLTIFMLGPVAFVIYAVLWYLMEPVAAPQPENQSPRAGGSTYAPPPSPSTSSRGAAKPADVRSRFHLLEQRLASLEECVASNEFDLRREFRKLEGT